MTLAVCLIFHPCPKWVLLVRTGELWRFDIYRKVPKDLTQPTYTGAIISVCCCLFILFLFLSELTGFIATEIVARCLFFDQNPRSKRDPVKSRRDEEGACSCALCGAQDGVSPSRVNELYVDDPDKESGGKIEVNLNISLPNLHCELVGLDIQDEMGRHEVGHIDNSMKVPLNNGDGCRFEGHFSINKVPGNFHVSTHSATAQPQNPDMTHIIHKLSFGDKLQEYVAYSHTGRIIPAIWFRYDLSPITVKYTERRQPLYRFITSICAIIGGTFTVAGILDSCIFTASEAWKKIQLGKMQ
ncbi:endoplasmic reticulum-Golgi intermediate compartment protein 1 isoform X4 [Gopherus evgoodei]|uniref:endoplasmic reticulum-Golgi intermediate compartment protein 1 isoform X4 n=1 Tax=Gopherus evgoodei TaxID=1825980 RepID=UPI0011D02B5F|nr:endoplasmic reticulum-Golgi intermediate compartment protein 1 isoform X4 [Gopherus evgoodei]